MNQEHLPLNPYEPPREDFSRVSKKLPCLRALRGPTLGLLCLAGLHLLFGLMMFVIGPLIAAIMVVITFIDSPEAVVSTLQEMFSDFTADPFFFLAFFVSTVSCFLIFRGARKMRRGEDYRRAKIAAILSCIPILSPIMYVGIPFGIWALVVLRRPDVRAEFQRRSDSSVS